MEKEYIYKIWDKEMKSWWSGTRSKRTIWTRRGDTEKNIRKSYRSRYLEVVSFRLVREEE